MQDRYKSRKPVLELRLGRFYWWPSLYTLDFVLSGHRTAHMTWPVPVSRNNIVAVTGQAARIVATSPVTFVGPL